MRPPNAFELATNLAHLHAWLSKQQIPFPGTRARAPSGLRLTIAPNHVTRFPSSNLNRVDLLHDGTPWKGEYAEWIVDRYRTASISKFFFWLSPREDAEAIEHDLLHIGFTRFDGTTYPTLLRRADRISLPPTSLTVQRLDTTRFEDQHGIYGSEDDRAFFRNSLGRPGLEHFMAFDGEVPVASSMLAIHKGLAYLFNAGTLESHRGRGAQSAMIAARVNRAAELGCEWAAVETLAFLETSLGNLKRAGFETVFEKKVFVWSAESA